MATTFLTSDWRSLRRRIKRTSPRLVSFSVRLVMRRLNNLPKARVRLTFEATSMHSAAFFRMHGKAMGTGIAI